jgi:hypothetical protein
MLKGIDQLRIVQTLTGSLTVWGMQAPVASNGAEDEEALDGSVLCSSQ